MPAVAAARCTLRSVSLRSATTKAATGAGRAATRNAPFPRSSWTARFAIRSPVEMCSYCAESLLPMHSVTSSALMTSLLTVSRRRYGWLPEACNDDV